MPKPLSAILLFAALVAAGCSDPFAGVSITEFVAAGSVGPADEDGDRPDWIEIHNATGRAIGLADWVLTDDPTGTRDWVLPAVEVPADGYLVVFASGKNRRDPAKPLHASFKLTRNGEFLALKRPDGRVATGFQPGYPEQVPGMAYGFCPTLPGRPCYLSPSPGKANPATGQAGLAQRPRLTTPSQVFVGSMVARVAAVDPAVDIRYTMDGSLPTRESARYGDGIPIAETTRLHVRAFVAGLAPSEVVAASFVAVTPELEGFGSDLPLVILAPGEEITEAWGDAHVHVVPKPEAGPTRIGGPRDYAGTGAVKVRGSTSAKWPKKSYAIELRNARGGDEDAALLGMPADSDWVLYGAYKYDRSLVRNAFVYELSNQLGRYAPRTRFCEVFLKSGPGPVGPADYRGVYSLVEKIKRGARRVAVEPRGLEGGYILKIDRPDPGDVGFAIDGQPIQFVYPKEAAISEEQRAWLTAHFAGLRAGLQRAPPGYASFIDVESWIDHHILNELTKNPEGLWRSNYFHKRRAGKVRMGPVWDFDRTMAPTGDARAADPVGFVPTRRQGWWGQLLADPGFAQAYAERWARLRQGPLATPNMHAIVDRLADRIRAAQARNFAAWPQVAPGPGGWQAGEIDRLKSWLARRADWLDGQFE